jgi:hypothetical protein
MSIIRKASSTVATVTTSNSCFSPILFRTYDGYSIQKHKWKLEIGRLILVTLNSCMVTTCMGESSPNEMFGQFYGNYTSSQFFGVFIADLVFSV